MNELTHGIRDGEIVTGCGSVGKSQFVRALSTALTTTEKRVGYIALEESIERTGLALLVRNGKCHLAPLKLMSLKRLARLSETIGFSCMTILGLLLRSLNRIGFMIKEEGRVCLIICLLLLVG